MKANWRLPPALPQREELPMFVTSGLPKFPQTMMKSAARPLALRPIRQLEHRLRAR
jgi:hypothetical protein